MRRSVPLLLLSGMSAACAVLAGLDAYETAPDAATPGDAGTTDVAAGLDGAFDGAPDAAADATLDHAPPAEAGGGAADGDAAVPPTFVQATVVMTGQSASLSNAQTGDLLIAAVECEDMGPASTPAGWSII